LQKTIYGNSAEKKRYAVPQGVKVTLNVANLCQLLQIVDNIYYCVQTRKMRGLFDFQDWRQWQKKDARTVKKLPRNLSKVEKVEKSTVAKLRNTMHQKIKPR